MAQVKSFRMDINNFNIAKLRLNEAMHQSLKNVAENVKPKIQQECPVDTGLLRQSTDWKVFQDNLMTILHLGTNVEYALAVHEGTYKMRARRYIYNVVIRNVAMIQVIINSTFGRYL